MNEKAMTHQERHDKILDEGSGECEVCGMFFTDILFADNVGAQVCGGHYRAEDESPSFHNGIKILER